MNRDELLDTLDELWTFTDERCYMLIAIARSKENEEIQATDQPTIRKLIEDRDELEDKLDQLQHACSRFPQRYRLYGTINGRNARDALHLLQKESLNWLRESEKSGETPTKLKRIDHEWKSMLHRPKCRDQKRFLWDLDTTSKSTCATLQKATEAHHIMTQETPNGYHIITEPFNFNEIEGFDPEANEFHGRECERKNDDMIFLGFIGDIDL